MPSARHDARDFALALDRRAAAVAIVNDAGLVTATNTAMQQLLGGQIDIRKGQLVARDTATTKAIETLIGSCLAANEALSGHPVLVCGGHHRQRLLLQAIPASGRMRERFADPFTRGGGAIIIVHDLDRDQPPSVTKPLVQMGLTPAEARIAELIGSGLSPNEAADRLGVGFETARKHLKQVFAKLNLRRQSQLAILVTKLQMMS